MIETFVRKRWFLILPVLVVLVIVLIGDYTSKELITRYKDEINNSPYLYDDIIDDIKKMPIEINTVAITCSGRDTIAHITSPEDDKWTTNYSFPARFVSFMTTHLYYSSGGIVSCYKKKYIQFVFFKTDEPLGSDSISVRMFYCDNDNIEGLKKVYKGYNFREINDDYLDDVNDMKENWIYKIKENWYVVGVHLKQ